MPFAEKSKSNPSQLESAGQELRFGFGENWLRFLGGFTSDTVNEAAQSFVSMLPEEEIRGRSFLDIGSGSGLSSLVAARLGADRVVSFDYDEQSVRATQSLIETAGRDLDCDWSVQQGDVLDGELLQRLGTFGVVYSWGVLHHTGSMWRAVENSLGLVAPGGSLFIALYNDQGVRSRIWWRVKRLYNQLPRLLRVPYVAAVMLPFELRWFAYSVKDGQPRSYLDQWKRYGSNRGMSRWRDHVDWVGGYPFETATVEDVVEFVTARGFEVVKINPNKGWGCSEFVFRRSAEGSDSTSGRKQ